jgi:DNA-binding Xre family transcriptional regulator
VSVSYLKLREILRERDIKKKELREKAFVRNDVLTKISKDEHMNTESLERIARYLGVNIGDIIELK